MSALNCGDGLWWLAHSKQSEIKVCPTCSLFCSVLADRKQSTSHVQAFAYDSVSILYSIAVYSIIYRMCTMLLYAVLNRTQGTWLQCRKLHLQTNYRSQHRCCKVGCFREACRLNICLLTKAKWGPSAPPVPFLTS